MTYAIAEQVVFEVVDGEAVLLDLDSGTYFKLNGVGARTWQLLEAGPRSLSELAEVLVQEFEVTPEVLVGDLEVLLSELSDAGLVRTSSRAG